MFEKLVNTFPFLKKTWVRTVLEFILSAVGMVILILIVYFGNIPNPNMILIAGLVIFASLFGYLGGVIAGLAMILYSMFFFSIDHSFFHYNELNGQKLLVIVIGVMVCIVFIGQIKLAQEKSKRQLKEANQSLKVANLSLEELSKKDPLTGVYNRHAIHLMMDSFKNKPIMILVVDIDDFKSINDEQGHPFGDEVIKAIAHILQTAFGQEKVFRIGGDEFFIIDQDSLDEEFQEKIDQFKQLVSIHWFGIDKMKIHCSGGYVKTTIHDYEGLLVAAKLADNNLYKAKEQGKDCFIGS